ncbi:hypothetical protein DN402_09155 [Streptomyces sp. SW4]|nr:hypothetical protein DN402_09155 [Streptomyces sp. SW4]
MVVDNEFFLIRDAPVRGASGGVWSRWGGARPVRQVVVSRAGRGSDVEDRVRRAVRWQDADPEVRGGGLDLL